MKKLTSVLTAATAIAVFALLTGCGSDSASPLITYVARDQNQGAAHLFTLNESSKVSTAVPIAIPATAQYVASNSTATAVVYERNDTNLYKIFLMGLDGVEKQLTAGPYDFAPEFSPDGKTVVYMSAQSSSDYQTFTMNIDGSNQTALYAPSQGILDQEYPVFSPDGKSVVFFVFFFDDQSSEPRHPLSNRPGLAAMPTRNVGSKARASRLVRRSSSTPTQSGYYRMALTDTSPTLVYATNNWWGPAAFSGDGAKLLLSIYDGTQWNIGAVNLDGTGFTPLTTDTDTLSFSPLPYKDLILFDRINQTDGSWQIYVMDQSGANQTLLSSTAVTYESLTDTYWDDY
jgi:Tol biopolymer transport system component